MSPSRRHGQRDPVPVRTHPDAPHSAKAAPTGGQPLAPEQRAHFENRFGHDFRAVRVHTDAAAAASAHALAAKAYALGSDLVFGAGQYAPGTAAGDALLAHELAHVTQQAHGGAPDGDVGRGEDNAEAMAAQALSGPGVRDSAYAMPLQPALAPELTSIGGVVSGTRPLYTIDDVKARLATFELGPDKGSEVVQALDEAGIRVMFWAEEGRIGMNFESSKLILLPREASLMANVSTLFHESVHARRSIPGSSGSRDNPEDVWANLEEEMRAQYDTFLFLRANAASNPGLASESVLAEDWPRLKSMNQEQVLEHFRTDGLLITLVGKIGEYAVVLKQFGRNTGRMAASPRAQEIVRRVVMSRPVPPVPAAPAAAPAKPAKAIVPGEDIKPPKPERPKLPPLYRPRTEFLDQARKSGDEQ